MKIRDIKYLIFSFLLFFLIVNSVFAQTALKNPLDPLCDPTKGDCGGFELVIQKLITGALGVSGVLALVAFVYGGVLWMVSAGNQTFIDKGRKAMIWAVWGLVVIFSSYAILSFVFGALYDTEVSDDIIETVGDIPI